MRLNCNMPDAVVFGTMNHRGMEFPEAYDLHDQLQITDTIRQLQWDKTVANDILVTLDNIQFNAGFAIPIMEDTRPRMDYVDQGLLASQRGRVEEIEATMWIEKAWAPKLQSGNDRSIMKGFTAIKGATPVQIREVNAVRLYLRVIIIADLTHPSGGYLPDRMLTGD